MTPDIIKEISNQKNDPDWMREFRLKALEVYEATHENTIADDSGLCIRVVRKLELNGIKIIKST